MASAPAGEVHTHDQRQSLSRLVTYGYLKIHFQSPTVFAHPHAHNIHIYKPHCIATARKARIIFRACTANTCTNQKYCTE